jgi:hypothetical protein
MFNRTKHSLAFTGVCLYLSCAVAHAALGGDASSILADADELRGTLHSNVFQQYEIREVESADGVRVREFLARDGAVFAVAWKGPALPNLRSLLGANFAIYEKAMSAVKEPGRQRSLRISSPDLVVEFAGHLRAYEGRAYLPESIPPGLSAADLR